MSAQPDTTAHRVDQTLQLLIPLLGLTETSPETAQLRNILTTRPDIDTLQKLQTHLLHPARRTGELRDLALRVTAEVQQREPNAPTELFAEDQQTLTAEEAAAKVRLAWKEQRPLDPPTPRPGLEL